MIEAMYKLMPQCLEETVMFKCDEDTFESLFDSSRLDDKPVRTDTRKRETPTATEVDALSKGGKTKRGKGKSVTCWVCNKTGHMSRDCFCNKGRSKGKRKARQSVEDGKVECFTYRDDRFGRDGTPSKGNKSGGKRKGHGNAEGKGKNQSQHQVKEDRQWEPADTQWNDSQFQPCDVWDAPHPYSSWEHGKNTHYVLYDGQDWIKFNYDTQRAFRCAR